MFRIGTLAAAIGLLVASESSFADYQVTCSNARGPANSTLWSYAIKNTDSKRLASDITAKVNGGPLSLIFTASVAQYLSKPNVLYVLVDNASENRILEFKGHPRHNWTGKFEAHLTELSAGQVLGRIRLKCTIGLL